MCTSIWLKYVYSFVIFLKYVGTQLSLMYVLQSASICVLPRVSICVLSSFSNMCTFVKYVPSHLSQRCVLPSVSNMCIIILLNLCTRIWLKYVFPCLSQVYPHPSQIFVLRSVSHPYMYSHLSQICVLQSVSNICTPDCPKYMYFRLSKMCTRIRLKYLYLNLSQTFVLPSFSKMFTPSITVPNMCSIYLKYMDTLCLKFLYSHLSQILVLKSFSQICVLQSVFYSICVFRTMWSRDRDVVLVGHAVDLGKPRGVGNLEWGGNGERGGQFTSNLGPRWTGSHHTKGGIPSK
jgi:hypothetical protein